MLGLGRDTRTSPGEPTALPVDGDLEPQEDGSGGPQQDLEVHPDRAATDVQAIDARLRRQELGDVVTAPVVRIEDFALTRKRELRKPCDPRTNAQDLPILLRSELDEAGILRARPDQAHVSLQHVPQLRDLVELRFREHAPESGEAIVLGSGKRPAPGVVDHLPELEHAELSTAVPHSPATEERRPTAVEPDPNGDQRDQRRQEDEQHRRGYHVEAALGELAERNHGVAAPVFSGCPGVSHVRREWIKPPQVVLLPQAHPHTPRRYLWFIPRK